MPSCGTCNVIRREVVEPLQEEYPDRVHILYDWDADLARIDGRKAVTNVPLFVIEDDGREEFRFSAFLKPGELEDIINCNADASAFEEVLV